MLSAPRELKAIGIGRLENIGLGRMSPFVKLGLDSMSGDWQGLDEEVEKLVDGFKSDFSTKASKMPPLGNFQSEAAGESPLSVRRLSELLRTFNSLIGRSGGPNGASGFDSLRRVFGTVNLLYQTFNDYRRYSDRASGSTFTNLRM
ncbi:MAG: hypothetical protein HKN33_02850 [Pyrinomonadaceae bacterium]|nr:hypothetical protein [Pyrinomonadaceae bacterium]